MWDIRLLGNKLFADKGILLSYFRNLKRNSGIYIGRSLLDSIYELAVELSDRENAIEIRKIFNRADLWEKRQIIRIVQKVLSEEEIRPWLKNIKQIEPNELFLFETASPTPNPHMAKKKRAKN